MGYLAEFGPMRIPTVHHYTMTLVRRLGLPLTPFIEEASPRIKYIHGKRYEGDDLDDWRKTSSLYHIYGITEEQMENVFHTFETILLKAVE